MQNKIRMNSFHKCGCKRIDKLCRKVFDKSYSVGDEHLLHTYRQVQTPHTTIKRYKECVIDGICFTAQTIKQSGFAGIGIADDGNRGEIIPFTVCHLLYAGFGDFSELFTHM